MCCLFLLDYFGLSCKLSLENGNMVTKGPVQKCINYHLNYVYSLLFVYFITNLIRLFSMMIIFK